MRLVYLEMADGSGKPHKFYEVTLDRHTVQRRWGRIGKAGQTLMFDYPSHRKAKEAAHALIRGKLRRGYKRARLGARLSLPVPRPAPDHRQLQLALPAAPPRRRRKEKP